MRTQIGSILTEKTGDIYTSVLDSVESYPAVPHEFVRQMYDKYLESHKSNPSVNGRMFEFIICETLVREGITPFYYQAEFTLVPNAGFDIVCYHDRRPVVLSAKVSLRERYKQADLEGFALSQVYRNAKSYLLTLHDEYVRVQKKIREGDVTGLTACIRADSPAYDTLLKELKRETFSTAQAIMPIKGKLVAYK